MSGSYGICGTPSYMAPEVLKKQSYGVKADVFSFGICLCELMTGKYPYENEPESTKSFEEAIVSGLRPAIPAHCPASVRHLIVSCWADDPDSRPTVDEIMDTLVLTERQLLAAECLTILDELPEELAKLVEEQKGELAFLTMSLKQLKGQLDAAQARATESEEKWEKERALREEAERQLKAVKDTLQQQLLSSADRPQQHSMSQPIPLLGVGGVPVLMRGSSITANADAAPGGRRMSIGMINAPHLGSRQSTGGAAAASTAAAASAAAPGAAVGIAISPRATYETIAAHRRASIPQQQRAVTPLVSPAVTPSSSPPSFIKPPQSQHRRSGSSSSLSSQPPLSFATIPQLQTVQQYPTM